MFTKIRNLIAFVFVMLTLASCGDEEGAPRMLWDVWYAPENHVYAEFYLDYHPQISIQTNNQDGEVILTCNNYKIVSLGYGNTSMAQSVSDKELCFTAKIEGENKIVITFENLPQTYDVSTDTFLKINGNNGKDSNMAVAKITRMP